MHTLATVESLIGSIMWGIACLLGGTIFGFVFCSRRAK